MFKSEVKKEFTHFILFDNYKHYKELNVELNKEYSIAGKYLLFSSDKLLLEENAKKIVETFGLSYFIISNINTNRGNFSYVCKIYDIRDRYSRDISIHILPGITYRYWKSEQLTRAKVYSPQFLENDREILTRRSTR